MAMYNTGFPMGYHPYNPQEYQNYQQQFQQMQQNYQQQLQNQVQQMSQPQNGGTFYFVNNIQEVESWVVNAGQTVFFFNRNDKTFYIKSVAQNGLTQPIEIYDYTQRVADSATVTAEDTTPKPEIDLSQYVTREEFDELKSKINSLESHKKNFKPQNGGNRNEQRI